MKKAIQIILGGILLIFLPTHRAYSQGRGEYAQVREYLDHLFEHLDKSKVPTGYLMDNSVNLLDLDYYSGTEITDTNFINISALNDILASVHSSAVVNSNSIPPICIDTTGVNDKKNEISLGIAVYKYNYIVSDALTSNKLRIQDDQVYDVFLNGEWVNPYGEKYVLAFSPTISACSTGTYTVKTPAAFRYTNLNLTAVEFDSGDGTGYRGITLGDEFSVAFSDEKTYELKLRVTLDNGTALVAHSYIDVNSSLSTSSSRHISIPDEVRTMTHEDVSAKLSIHYSQGHNSLEYPMIIVEGFDPLFLASSLLTGTYNEDYRNNVLANGFTNYSDYINSLQSYGNYFYQNYDIIYVDWNNSEAPIEKNGDLLIDILDWVNETKVSKNNNIVIGYSMGGLVARYALTTMEHSARKHQTEIYVSYDSPHLGVNIPLGFQYLIHYLFEYWTGATKITQVALSEIAKNIGFNETTLTSIYNLLYGQSSATQMMMSHVDSDGTINNSYFDAFQAKMLELGFPQGDDGEIFNLGVSNGRNKGYWDNANNLLFSLNLGAESGWLVDIALLKFWGLGIFADAVLKAKGLFLVPGKSSLSLTASAYAALHQNQKIAESNLTFNKKLFWFGKTVNQVLFSRENTLNAPTAYDAILGSYYGIDLSRIETVGCDGNATLGEYSYTFSAADKFTFVPTASALCVGQGQRSLAMDEYMSNAYYANNSNIDTPFDFYMTPYSASTAPTTSYFYHTAEYAAVYQKIKERLSIEIVGPTSPVSGDTYSVRNISTPVSWSSDKDWLTISPDGTVTVSSTAADGKATITAHWTDSGIEQSLSKTIYAGFPDFVLQARVVTTSSDDMTATCLITAKLAEPGALNGFPSGYITSYEWAITSESAYNRVPKWETSANNFHSIKLPALKPRWIYFRVNSTNYTSKVYCIKVQYKLSGRLIVLVGTNGISVIDEEGTLREDFNDVISADTITVSAIKEVINGEALMRITYINDSASQESIPVLIYRVND